MFYNLFIIYLLFLTTEDFSPIWPKPGILQSISWPSSGSTNLIPLTFVPCLIAVEEPLTFKSFTTVTVSPSFSTTPLTSLITFSSSFVFSFIFLLFY